MMQKPEQSPKAIVIKGLSSPALYLREKEGYRSPSDKKIGQFIPQYPNLTVSAKQRQLDHWLNHGAKVVCYVKPKQRLPNAKKEKSKNALRAGAQAFLEGTAIFEAPAAGYTILGDFLKGFHMTALHKAEPSLLCVLSINSGSSTLNEILSSLVEAAVPRRRWSGKHYEVRRDAVLNYRDRSSNGIAAHIQDFSRMKVRYKKHEIKTAFPYRDTVLLIVDANSAQIKEAAAYIECAAVILLDSSPGDLTPTKLPGSSVSAYDSAIAARFAGESRYISAVLRWWWGKALAHEEAWAREIVQKARDSFGKPDSRYKQVILDPKRLRDAIRYRVFLSFLDAVEANQLMTSDELNPYRQGAKDVFDPAPPEPIVLRRAEDPNVFLEIMCDLVHNFPERIVPGDKRFVKADKPLAAWRIIGHADKECYLVLLEETWKSIYMKEARSRKDVDCSFFQRSNWAGNLQELLVKQGLIKPASSGYRYRYDLLGNGTRDSTYVLAIPSHLLKK